MDCRSCGTSNRPGARFCDACGTALAQRPSDDAAARKVVTIVFADLIGSTALHERLDAESARRLMDDYYRTLREVVAAHGGVVVKLLGDGVMSAFGVPAVGEDDALRAVRAAAGMQRAFRALVGTDGRIGLRVGVNTGEVIVSADHADVVGDPVNVAARLQQAADDGDVLIGEATWRLVAELVTLAPFGNLTLKGRSETVMAHRVVSLERPTGTGATPFVGRDDEIRRLLTVYETAIAAPATRLAVVLGSPGLGKSRLVGEVTRRLEGRARVLTVRCDAAGGTGLVALAQAVRGALPPFDGTEEALRRALETVLPNDDERTRIASGLAALFAGSPASPEETFFVVRRLFAAFATTAPVVLAIDDLQWAEPLLLDLCEHLAQWGAGTGLFVLLAARPELRALRPSLVADDGLVATVLTLAGLDAGAATRLAASVIGADALPAAVAGRVLATSEGNPLFVGELVRMLVHDGALRREGDRWTAGVEIAALEMPPTIHALLAARIERLPPAERTVLERAAIVGRHFSRAAVAHLLGADADDLDRRLESLRRSEFLEADGGTFVGEPALRFHHALVRDAAYRRMLKGTRASLHAQVAEWMEGRVGNAAEHDETIGWHWEQAHLHLRELGAVDDRGWDFGRRAARHLAAAGRRALEREDLALAATLLDRALAGLESDDPQRADLVLDRCEALLSAGEVGPAAAAVSDLRRLAGESDRLRAWHTCFAGQLAVLTQPQELRATAAAVEAAATVMAAVGDLPGEAKAHAVHATALARLGRIGACEEALDRALAAARRARDRRRANAVLGGAPTAALWGPSPVTRASGRCLDVVRVLRITQGSPGVEAVALRCQAVLEALRGRGEAARRMIESSRHMVEELGITQRVLEAELFAGLIALIDGDAVAAEGALRAAYAGLERHGLAIDAAHAAALLGRALLAQDRVAEAEAVTHESEALAGDDLKAAIAWRGVRAEALARRGAHGQAIELARAAVDIAAATDALLDHADARLALATALRAAGRDDEAWNEEGRAVELWDAKGAVVLAERVRGSRGTPAAVAPGRTLPTGERCRVVPNAATANSARVDAAMAARDYETLPRCLAENLVVVHHPTGVTHDAAATLQGWRAHFRAAGATWRLDPLATLGDSLGLFRQQVSAAGLSGTTLDVGAYDRDDFAVVEVDAQGRNRWTEVFANDRLGAAIAHLYARHAALLPAGSERDRAESIARAIALLLEPPDLARYGAAIAADVEFVDHRSMGTGHGRGRDEFLRALGALLDVSGDARTRVDDVLGLEADATLLRWTSFGTHRAGGGAYERPLLLLWVFGADGRLARFEQFDVDRLDEALARFDALRIGPTVFENAVSRGQARAEERWHARDWDGVVACFAPGFTMDDRRALVGHNLDGAAALANVRLLFESERSRWRHETLATRLDRLALFRLRFTGEVRGGAFAEEHLAIVEHDGDGRIARIILFDEGALADASRELDARFAAGDGAPHGPMLAALEEYRRAVAAMDLDALARLLPDDFRLTSHRRFAGIGTSMDRDGYLASLVAMDDFELRADIRVDHVLRVAPGGGVGVFTWHGTRNGGPFETPMIFAFTWDPGGLRSWEMSDVADVAAVLARFDERQRAAPPDDAHPFLSNAATRTADRFDAAWAARDWDGLSALVAPGFQCSERRRMMQVDLDRTQYLYGMRIAWDMGSRSHRSLLATRGEWLALYHRHLVSPEGDVGPSEIDWLYILEVDERGRCAVGVTFDTDDLAGAHAALEARFDAGEAAAHSHIAMTRAFLRAFAARDWAALAALLAPDLEVYDHRLLGWEALRGPASYIEALRTLVELAPDVQLRVDHVRVSARAIFYVPVWVGTREGGAFETPSVFVAVVDEEGRIRRFDQYDLDQLDDARARFEASG